MNINGIVFRADGNHVNEQRRKNTVEAMVLILANSLDKPQAASAVAKPLVPLQVNNWMMMKSPKSNSAYANSG